MSPGNLTLTLNGRCCVVWDNCGSYNVATVKSVLAEWDIIPENLPPNLTDLIQVMDLIVNGPVKSGIRVERIQALFNYFQSWKIKRLQHMAVENQTDPPPSFTPPKPKVADGLQTLIKVLNTSLSTPAFESSLHKCFIEVGLLKGEDGTFVQFAYKKKGFLTRHIPQVQSSEDKVSVGEIAAELALTSRPADADDNSDVESGSDNDSADEQEEDEGDE